MRNHGPDLATLSALSTWPTPAAQEAGGTPEQFLARKQKAKENGASLGVSLTSLSLVSTLAGWPTPMAGSPGTETYNAAGNTDSSRKTQALVTEIQGPARLTASGALLTGSSAATASRGRSDRGLPGQRGIF
jgi:hypothetical protein